MQCYSPLLAYQCANGEVVFVERQRYDIVRELSLPCGQCIGCRINRSQKWALRCMHEASLHERNAFVTLTYDDEHLPERGMLDYVDFQKFIRRLRKDGNAVRFYMCGEYGPQTWRPHYHACLFGMDFDDKEFFATMPGSGASIYRSDYLERMWPFGNSSIGDVTHQSAGYVARYCVQKITGHAANAHYSRRDLGGDYLLPPEFNKMSLKPGIGAGWLEKYMTDVYPHDYVVASNGKKMKPPKFYDKMYAEHDPDSWDQLQWAREMEGRSHYDDNVPARLHAKQEVARVSASFLKRTLE